MDHFEGGAEVYLQAVLCYEEPGREKCPGKSFPMSGVIADGVFTHRRRWWYPPHKWHFAWGSDHGVELGKTESCVSSV